MTLPILAEVLLIAFGLSIDSFSVALTDGLTYQDMNKRKAFFIAFVFAIMQVLMPLISFWLIELVEVIAGAIAGETAGIIISKVIVWVAFMLLLFLGVKMIIESIIELRKVKELKRTKKFSVKEVLFYGFATSVDALATGVVLHAGISDMATVWLHGAMIFVICFSLSLVGLFLGKQIVKLLKGNVEISGIIGGVILVLLAIWVVVSHYAGL